MNPFEPLHISVSQWFIAWIHIFDDNIPIFDVSLGYIRVESWGPQRLTNVVYPMIHLQLADATGWSMIDCSKSHRTNGLSHSPMKKNGGFPSHGGTHYHPPFPQDITGCSINHPFFGTIYGNHPAIWPPTTRPRQTQRSFPRNSGRPSLSHRWGPATRSWHSSEALALQRRPRQHCGPGTSSLPPVGKACFGKEGGNMTVGAKKWGVLVFGSVLQYESIDQTEKWGDLSMQFMGIQSSKVGI